MLCTENHKDIEEIPEVYLNGVNFHYVDSVQDVWDFALTEDYVDNPISFEIKEENEQ